MALTLSGCGAQNALRKKAVLPLPADSVLHLSLERFDHWTSLFATLKLRLSVHDTNFTARGHVMYLAGERYEVGFEHPYNRFLGTLYVTPSQLIYFDTHNFPNRYSLKDTVILSQLIPMGVPNWDPRDILPFPVSGRTAGFQTDSVLTRGGRTWVYGNSDQVWYALGLDSGENAVAEEQVQRAGRDLVVKKYDRIKTVQGWQVATRITCSNQSGSVRFTWSLGGIQLKVRNLPSNVSISPSK